MKIVFFGSSSFVAPVLDILKTNFEVVAIFNSTDQEIDKEKLVDLNPDLFVVASYGKILSNEILEIPKHGSLNLHPSLLPLYRGASPIQSAILNGDKTTGITIIKMDEEMDHGPILFQKEEEIKDDDAFDTLSKKLFNIGADHLTTTINDYISGKLRPIPQNDSKATFTKTLTRQDGFIDINNPPSAENIKLMIRAYFPWPGAFVKSNLGGKEKIIKLLPEEKVQVEGKNPMSYKDFINGYNEGENVLRKIGLF